MFTGLQQTNSLPQEYVKLTPIAVHGTFDKVGVDVVQLPDEEREPLYGSLNGLPNKVARGICNPGPERTNVSQALEVIRRHVSWHQLLSDGGPPFRSKHFLSVCSKLRGSRKIILLPTIPRQWFNCTLIGVLSKRVSGVDQEWDDLLPYVLFAYIVLTINLASTSKQIYNRVIEQLLQPRPETRNNMAGD